MEDLIDILKEFDVNRDAAINSNDWKNKSVEEKYNAIAEWFKPCAKKILCEGYFIVNGKYIIDLGCIELYYHEEEGTEEEGAIKDHIMYHTNEHSSKSELCKVEYPYFEIGSFNFHQSGVDVTFEKEKDEKTGDDKKYRASFLIRAYRVIRNDDENDVLSKLFDPNPKFDYCSTHLYDDMFPNGFIFDGTYKIDWKKCNPKGGILKNDYRQNVAEYEYKGLKKDGKPDFQKIIAEINKEHTEEYYKNRPTEYFKTNSKYYKRDQRQWQFSREGQIEK